MNLTDRTIRVVSTQISNHPVESVIRVEVLNSVAEGVNISEGVYELTFEDTFSGPQDPKLLSAIVDKLESI